MSSCKINDYALLVFGLLTLSLWSSITNFVPLSISFIALLPFIAYALLRTNSLPRAVAALLVLYVYFALSTLAYAPQSFIDPSFYRRDGNFFVTFLPVLAGGILTIRVNIEKLVQVFVQWVTLINIIFISIFLVTGGTIFIKEEGVYHLLFESHNAAGGFLATVTSLALGLYFGKGRTFLSLAMILINLIGLILTVSRGSVLGLLMAVVLVLLLKERFAMLMSIGLGVVTTVLLAFTYPVWVAYGKPSSISLIEGQSLAGSELAVGDANTSDRVLFLWPRALDLFFQSPLVGTGFGSYNDVPYNFRGIPHVLSFNKPAELIFSSSHAHHSYLHVLAETGAIGLGLLVLMLHQVWKAIGTFDQGSVRSGLKIAFWVAVFSSATEHRMFTPAQMLPFTIILGLALANKQWQKKQARWLNEVQSVPGPALI